MKKENEEIKPVRKELNIPSFWMREDELLNNHLFEQRLQHFGGVLEVGVEDASVCVKGLSREVVVLGKCVTVAIVQPASHMVEDPQVAASAPTEHLEEVLEAPHLLQTPFQLLTPSLDELPALLAHFLVFAARSLPVLAVHVQVDDNLPVFRHVFELRASHPLLGRQLLVDGAGLHPLWFALEYVFLPVLSRHLAVVPSLDIAWQH